MERTFSEVLKVIEQIPGDKEKAEYALSFLKSLAANEEAGKSTDTSENHQNKEKILSPVLENANPQSGDRKNKTYQGFSSFVDFTKAGIADESLHETERMLMNLYINMDEGVGLHKMVFDEQGNAVNYRIIGINPRFEKILGMSESDVHDRLATEVYGVGEAPFIKEYLEVVKTGNPCSLEVFFPPMKKYFSISVSTWGRDSFATIFTDITDRKNAEEIIRESENKYRTIFENIQDVFYKVDAQGRITDISPSIKRYSGFTREELIGMMAEDIYMVPGDRNLLMQELNSKGEVSDYDIQLKSKEGKGVWASMNVHLLYDPSGNPTGLEGSLRDVTRRKIAEERMLESETKFRSLTENSPYAIMIYQDDVWVYSNPAFWEISGYTQEELYNRKYWEIVVPESRDFVKQIGTKRQKGYQIKVSYEIQLLTKDGSTKWVFLTGNSIIYAGRPAGIVSVVDISDRKKMELDLKTAMEKAQESDRLKSSFLANMSHEIRTPMNAILGFSELIGQPDTSGQDQERYAGIIKNSGKRLLHIINDIIDLSKLEAGQIEISRSPCNIYNLVNSTVESFRNMDLLKQKTELSLFADLNEITPEVVMNTDPLRLQQVLDNLVTNAIKYSRRGTITVGARPKKKNSEDVMEFYVKDTGKGIPAGKIPIIFERFRQVEENEYHEGAGLGLSICKAFVEMLGGNIHVESEVDKGSLFTFSIPFIPVLSGKENTDSGVQKSSINLRGTTILIAEDEDDSYIYLQRLLKGTKAVLLRAENGDILMDMIAANMPDLILLDINMPGKTGYECLREIREKKYSLKVIAQTAYVMADERKHCLEAGCDGYLAKPFNKKELFECISEALRSA